VSDTAADHGATSDAPSTLVGASSVACARDPLALRERTAVQPYVASTRADLCSAFTRIATIRVLPSSALFPRSTHLLPPDAHDIVTVPVEAKVCVSIVSTV